MTVSPAADHKEPTPEEKARRRENCPHSDPEGEVVTAISGGLEVEAWCPDCQTCLYTHVELEEMRETDAHGWS